MTGAPPLTLRHVGINTEAFDDFCQVMQDAFELDVSLDRDGRAAVHLGADQLLVTRKAANSTDQGTRALDHLELGAVEPQTLMERLEAAGLLVDVHSSGSRTTFLLSPEAWSGVPLRVANAAPVRRPLAADRNVMGIDHIGVASPDNNRAREAFCGLLGLEVESVQTDTEASLRVEQFTSDKYGVRVQHTTGPVTGLRVLFVTLGSFEFEFLQDLNAGTQRMSGASSSTAGDQGAIANYIERSGPGLHHIALRVKDMRMALQQAEAGGVRLLDREGRPGSRRGQIAFMHPKSTGGVLFHFVQRD
jgi:methylmalonyl-CoA epimerase